ncbi:MAG: elongation factor P [Parcubacteria group bacterium]|nr:elongation factor P [Parcubacteria group bacterium]
MISLGSIKRGMAIVHNGEPYVVTDAAHSKQGRAGAVLRAKLKNLKTGSVVETTFQGNEKIEPADLANKRVQFLYADDLGAHFMDQSYEQFSLPRDVVEDSLGYLKEGQEIDIMVWEHNPVNLKLPPKVDLKVTEAPPAVKGDTANNPAKTVMLETGITVQAPMFVKAGDVVRVNTETGGYVERVT